MVAVVVVSSPPLHPSGCCCAAVPEFRYNDNSISYSQSPRLLILKEKRPDSLPAYLIGIVTRLSNNTVIGRRELFNSAFNHLRKKNYFPPAFYFIIFLCGVLHNSPNVLSTKEILVAILDTSLIL